MTGAVLAVAALTLLSLSGPMGADRKVAAPESIMLHPVLHFGEKSGRCGSTSRRLPKSTPQSGCSWYPMMHPSEAA
jgi:hypothetical protein